MQGFLASAKVVRIPYDTAPTTTLRRFLRGCCCIGVALPLGSSGSLFCAGLNSKLPTEHPAKDLCEASFTFVVV